MKIPATILTGFLGSGKTTVIRNLLAKNRGRRIALMVNEFGDLGVDGEILRGCGIESCGDDGIVELANGCICCTVADEFLPAMQKLIEDDVSPDHIIIETSGLALPQPLVRAFNWPGIKTKVTVDGVVTIVDGPAFKAGQFAHDLSAVERQRAQTDGLDHETPVSELFEDQLACADIVVLNKSDILGTEGTTGTVQDLKRMIRSGASVIATQFGKLDPEIILGIDKAAEDDLASREEIHHNAGGNTEEEHGHDEFKSIVLDLSEVKDTGKFIECARSVGTSEGIFRIKGFAAVEKKPMRFVVQGVSARVDSYFDRLFADGERRATKIVVIGEADFDETWVIQEFQKAVS